MLDDVEELAATKFRMSDMASLANRPTFQKGLAHHVAAWRAADQLPGDPTFSVPPTMIESTLTVECEDVDAVCVASGGSGLAGEGPAERFPIVPAFAVPVAIAKLPIVVDGEELALSAITPRRDGRAPLERAAQ